MGRLTKKVRRQNRREHRQEREHDETIMLLRYELAKLPSPFQSRFLRVSFANWPEEVRYFIHGSKIGHSPGDNFKMIEKFPYLFYYASAKAFLIAGIRPGTSVQRFFQHIFFERQVMSIIFAMIRSPRKLAP